MKILKGKYKLKQYSTRTSLVLVALVAIIAVPIQVTQRAFADVYDDKIAALQEDIKKYNAQAEALAKEADTLENVVAKLQKQADALQSQINLSQAKYNKLVKQIKDTEKKIADNKEALGKTIADMYVDGKITPIEMLASSDSIGDYLDKQEYQSSIRNQLAATIDKVKALKTQLEKQKTDQKAILDKQKAQQKSLAANQYQQQSILNETRGQEAAYQQLVADNKTRLESVAAQQRAYYQSLLNSGGNGSSGVVGNFEYANWSGNSPCGSDGYPYCGVQDSYSDPWALYNRECVSYAAWALSARFGRFVGSFNGSGNAYEWPTSAVIYSGAVRVYNPQPGDAVVLPAMAGFSPIGHLMIVESVNNNWVHVSQYNFYGTGEYSTMDIKNSGVIYLRFPQA
jgi:peptidoglycan hydrolase CwlO-like protein/surface antigen